jgi:KUP system potassium uptake protein
MFRRGLFYGDGVITPAISVLSAVRVLEVVSPAKQYVIPITLLILLALFAVQNMAPAGSDGFGPITWCGFVAIGLLGVMQIVGNPTILKD